MTQDQTIRILKKVFEQYSIEPRLIKIHGGQYQEKGLPDLLVLMPDEPNWWLEIKANWNDTPTKLQQHNIEQLRKYGFVTGYLVGNQFKFRWNSNIIHPVEYLIHDKHFQKCKFNNYKECPFCSTAGSPELKCGIAHTEDGTSRIILLNSCPKTKIEKREKR